MHSFEQITRPFVRSQIDSLIDCIATHAARVGRNKPSPSSGLFFLSLLNRKHRSAGQGRAGRRTHLRVRQADGQRHTRERLSGQTNERTEGAH